MHNHYEIYLKHEKYNFGLHRSRKLDYCFIRLDYALGNEQNTEYHDN